jgi:hypothetical protein
MSWEIVGRELIGHEKKKKKEQKRVWKKISEKNWESSQFWSFKKSEPETTIIWPKKVNSLSTPIYTMSSLSVCL